jgi:N-acetylmuramoyl-L-alanine amidase
MNAMPSILIETGFVNNYDDAHYISTEEGQQACRKASSTLLQVIRKWLTEM